MRVWNGGEECFKSECCENRILFNEVIESKVVVFSVSEEVNVMFKVVVGKSFVYVVLVESIRWFIVSL